MTPENLRPTRSRRLAQLDEQLANRGLHRANLCALRREALEAGDSQTAADCDTALELRPGYLLAAWRCIQVIETARAA